jgi:hypothetical protein
MLRQNQARGDNEHLRSAPAFGTKMRNHFPIRRTAVRMPARLYACKAVSWRIAEFSFPGSNSSVFE